jgi:hypothetical protein
MDSGESHSDPVRAKRAQVAKWTLLAISAFVMAFVIGFKGPLVTLVTVSLVIGSVLLAPSIVLGYAVKAAEREDRERGL